MKKFVAIIILIQSSNILCSNSRENQIESLKKIIDITIRYNHENNVSNSYNIYNNNVVHYAVKMNDINNLEMLIQNNENNIDRPNTHGVTPFMVAAYLNKIECIEILLPHVGEKSKVLAKLLTCNNQIIDKIDSYKNNIFDQSCN